MIVPSSPTSTGLVQPHSWIEAAIWSTCAVAVGAGIPRIRNQPLDRPALDLVGGPGGLVGAAGRLVVVRPVGVCLAGLRLFAFCTGLPDV